MVLRQPPPLSFSTIKQKNKKNLSNQKKIVSLHHLSREYIPYYNLIINQERCRSGRSGRSRKPLTSLLVPGFESLSLRREVAITQKSYSDFSFYFHKKSIIYSNKAIHKKSHSKIFIYPYLKKIFVSLHS